MIPSDVRLSVLQRPRAEAKIRGHDQKQPSQGGHESSLLPLVNQSTHTANSSRTEAQSKILSDSARQSRTENQRGNHQAESLGFFDCASYHRT